VAESAISGALELDTSATKTLTRDPEFERPKMAYSKDLKNETVDLSTSEPVLTAEQVKKQYGVDLGELTAVVELPAPQAYGGGYDAFRPKLVYAFTQASADARHAKPTHFVMGQQSLDALHAAAVTGDRIDESLTSDVLTLSRGSNEEVIIGREGWLPELGYDTDMVRTDPGVRAQYETVSRSQVMLSVTEAGGLAITDLNSHNGTMAYYGAPIEG
jgi:hypothetical protein